MIAVTLRANGHKAFRQRELMGTRQNKKSLFGSFFHLVHGLFSNNLKLQRRYLLCYYIIQKSCYKWPQLHTQTDKIIFDLLFVFLFVSYSKAFEHLRRFQFWVSGLWLGGFIKNMDISFGDIFRVIKQNIFFFW